MKKLNLVFLFLLSAISFSVAQDTTKPIVKGIKKTDSIAEGVVSKPWIQPIKWNLSKSGDKFIQFGGYVQVFAGGWSNNPGTTVGANTAISNLSEKKLDYNVGLRRVRLNFNTTFSPRWTTLLSFGFNNYYATTVATAAPSLQILDALINFKALDGLNIAFGTTQDGFTRLTGYSASGSIFDDEGIAQPEVNITDNLLRQFGVFINGNIKRFNYRTAFLRPFLFNSTTNYETPIGGLVRAPNGQQASQLAYNTTSIEMKGYFTWDFWDIDPAGIPGISLKTNNLGAKKILNLGVGIMYRNRATATYKDPTMVGGAFADSSLVYRDMIHFSADFLLDLPLNRAQNEVFTLYSIFANYNFGPNYFRTTNLYGFTGNSRYNASSSHSLYAGNTEPLLGTGNAWETQIAYLLPKKWWFKKAGQVQVGMFYSLLDLEAFNHHLIHRIDALLNFYFASNLKVGLIYHARPLFTKNISDLNAQTIQRGFGNQLSLMVQFQW